MHNFLLSDEQRKEQLAELEDVTKLAAFKSTVKYCFRELRGTIKGEGYSPAPMGIRQNVKKSDLQVMATALQGYNSKLLRADLEIIICNHRHPPDEDLAKRVTEAIARKLERQTASASASGASSESRDTASLRVFFQAPETEHRNPKAYFFPGATEKNPSQETCDKLEKGKTAQQKIANEAAECAGTQHDEEDEVETQTTAGAFDDDDVHTNPVCEPDQSDQTLDDKLEGRDINKDTDRMQAVENLAHMFWRHEQESEDAQGEKEGDEEVGEEGNHNHDDDNDDDADADDANDDHDDHNRDTEIHTDDRVTEEEVAIGEDQDDTLEDDFEDSEGEEEMEMDDY